FQAEDGIRDWSVTGVQTCALPIYPVWGGVQMARLTETDWIWHDGGFVAWKDAQVHVLSHSMQFGSSIFEGIRCYKTPNGPAIFRLPDPLRRMVNSCRIYRIELPYTVDELVAACCELVQRNAVDSCYIRPMVVRG